MSIDKQDKPILEQEQEARPWVETPRVRPPWVPIKHGKIVLPQNVQKSTNDLTDEQVLQPRAQKVEQASTAKPLAGRHDTGHGASDEPGGKRGNSFNRVD